LVQDKLIKTSRSSAGRPAQAEPAMTLDTPSEVKNGSGGIEKERRRDFAVSA
jgi:hypothetical protein